MTITPEQIKRLTDAQLKTFLETIRRQGNATVVNALVREMVERGIAKPPHLTLVYWNQARISKMLLPFAKIAERVSNNRRTFFTKAGGDKIGKSKDDADKQWIDSYCGIKTAKLNIVFGARVKYPGDDPVFYLSQGGKSTTGKVRTYYDPDRLDAALVEWTALAEKAMET